ncbi:MAG TPA: papain-like cysteine protease family protein, partial [Dehalococcoidia bacterium]|nr:papain-like cysteine protease family protein [Dehalococcoidia bacterium]
VAKASFLAPEPVFGQGPYVMLPGMTYTWRVRVSDAKTSIGSDDPSWSPWSEERAFHTRAASSGTISLSSPTEGLIPTTLPAVVWKDSDSAIFYYEVQLSADPQFRTGSDGIASVFSNLVHSGESLPPRSWTVPRSFALPPGHFYWRVRPRIQGDGTPVGWSTTFSFQVPVTPGAIVISEVLPIGSAETAPWAELVNRASGPAPLAGAMLTDEDGNRYTFTSALPDVPVGAFVVVYFDGQGSGIDDYDFSDGRAVLHSTNAMISPFEVTGDQLALYRTQDARPDTLIDFVAWGIDPTVDAANAVAASLWTTGTFLPGGRGGDTSGEVEAGESLGILPGQPQGFLESWSTYRNGETTPGQPNGIPSTGVIIPSDGAMLLRQDFRLAWYNVPDAVQYQLQIDRNADFNSPVVDIVLAEPYYAPTTPPVDSAYFWRTWAIDAAGNKSPFSPPTQFTLVTLEPLELPSPPAEGVSSFSVAPPRLSAEASWQVDYLNTLVPILQRKDTNMLCWDGDDETGARKPWDGPHADTPGNHSNHGRNYCARASIAMINKYYGGDLSQDRLSYEHFKRNGNLQRALGHDVTLGWEEGRALLSWALNNAPVTLTVGKPAWAQIQGWTTERRPVLVSIPGHAIVLRGWAIYNGPDPALNGTRFVIYNDPWDGLMHLQDYNSINLRNFRVPGGTPAGRQQEAGVTTDTDGDGIVDFDEQVRFGTSHTSRDTDNDCVPDKADMHSYIYQPHGNYLAPSPDFDGDGLRNELDRDSDNGGVIDGDEDWNWNGHMDGRDTSNAYSDPTDDLRAVYGCTPPPTPTPTSTRTPTATSTST